MNHKKEISKYEDESKLFMRTWKLPPTFLTFSTFTLHLSILALFNKSKPINHQFSQNKLRRGAKYSITKMKISHI